MSRSIIESFADKSVPREAMSSGRNEWVLVVLLVSMCFQNIDLLPFGSMAIKLYHVLVLVLFVASLAQRGPHWRLPDRIFTVAFLAVMLITLIDAFGFGLNSFFFKYIIFFVIIATVYNLGCSLSINQWQRVVRRSSLLVLTLVFIKLLFNYDAILSFLSNPWGGHPVIDTFFGGGVNLEASWIAMFGVFFEKNAKGNLYLSSSLLISLMYSSRTGLILSVLSIIYVYIIRPKNRDVVNRFFQILFVIFILVIAMQVFGSTIIERFLSIGDADEGGSSQRIKMWGYALLAFQHAPIFGVGAGNAMPHIEALTNQLFFEDNVHNYSLQVLLDFGLIGFIVFACLVAGFLHNNIMKGFTNPFAACITCYLIASFFQFAGADSLLGFAIAGYFATSSAQEEIVLSEHLHPARDDCFVEIKDDSVKTVGLP